jgi:hypothetical protein
MAQQITVTIPGDLETVSGKTDDRGRLNLGSEFSDQNVMVAILEGEPADGIERQTAD